MTPNVTCLIGFYYLERKDGQFVKSLERTSDVMHATSSIAYIVQLLFHAATLNATRFMIDIVRCADL